MKSWGSRHDFTLGDVRLLSYSTGVQGDGTEEMMFTGYGSPNRRQHLYFRRSGDTVVGGGTVLSQDDKQLSNLSLTADPPAHVLTVEAIYDSRDDSYDVKFVEVVPGSTVSTPPWEARPAKNETHALPGSTGESHRWDVSLGVGSQMAELHRRAEASSMATIVDFLPESSGALLIEGRRL
jgi:hypothetical protein